MELSNNQNKKEIKEVFDEFNQFWYQAKYHQLNE